MLHEIKWCIQNKNGSKLKNCFKSILPQKIVSNIVFLKHHRRTIDYKNPTLLDEKLLILKDGAYRNNAHITQCADKLAVREYIKEKGIADILVGLVGSYDSVHEIDWDALPNKFAIKCNHGSGYNVIVTDKQAVSKEDVYEQLAQWMQQDYATVSAELHYRGIKRKIIAEEYIETESGKFPADYKFFASRGNVICLLLIADRGTNKRRVYLDKDFNDLHLVDEYQEDDYKKYKPAGFSKMIEVAKLLSEDFPFVRVDLYDKDGQVLFGELTFTPHGCCHDYLDDAAQEWIGEKIIL